MGEEGEPVPKKKKILSEVENNEDGSGDFDVKKGPDVENGKETSKRLGLVDYDDENDDDTVNDKTDDKDDDKVDDKVNDKVNDKDDEDQVGDKVNDDKVNDDNVDDKKEGEEADDNEKNDAADDNEEEGEEGERIDKEEDRSYNEKLVGERIKGNYENGWATGTIQWFNSKL